MNCFASLCVLKVRKKLNAALGRLKQFHVAC